MMSISPIFASFFIATLLISTCARADNVYKCGNTYSQTPCPQGQTISIDDTRNAEQKRQTDEATRRDDKLANSLQKDRLTQEQKVKALRTRSATAEIAPDKVASPTPTEPRLTKITPKRLKTKTYKPAGFVALVPGSDAKPAKSKKTHPKKLPDE